MSDWEKYYARCVANSRCPYSGETIRRCKATDLCDCYDFPEADK